MYYRRKLILALLELFDGKLEKIRLQKLLFLFAQSQDKPEYDFVPYRFGCYSFSAAADLSTMVKKSQLKEEEKHFEKMDIARYFTQLRPKDQATLKDIKATYGKLSTTELTKTTYIQSPFYATRSEIAESILSKEEFAKVQASKPRQNTTVLFTIGYEGISLEEYLLRLLKNNIHVLVDVRNNPLSMKFGFSKSQLRKYCEFLGIRYFHFPEVGIQSSLRRELHSQSDYDKLFAEYDDACIPMTGKTQNAILNILIQQKRIALTCFESNIHQCHRKHLSEAIEKLPGFKFEVKHI